MGGAAAGQDVFGGDSSGRPGCAYGRRRSRAAYENRICRNAWPNWCADFPYPTPSPLVLGPPVNPIRLASSAPQLNLKSSRTKKQITTGAEPKMDCGWIRSPRRQRWRRWLEKPCGEHAQGALCVASFFGAARRLKLSGDVAPVILLVSSSSKGFCSGSVRNNNSYGRRRRRR